MWKSLTHIRRTLNLGSLFSFTSSCSNSQLDAGHINLILLVVISDKWWRRIMHNAQTQLRSIYISFFFKFFFCLFFFFFKKFTFFYLFIYFIYLWLCWVFVSVRGLSLVAASGDHSSSRCAGLSPSQPLLLWSTGSRRAGSVIVAHGPSCSVACGIFPDQGSNPCPLHCQADSQPLRHQGSPHQFLYLWKCLTYESGLRREKAWEWLPHNIDKLSVIFLFFWNNFL